jgi:hypothetical protein
LQVGSPAELKLTLTLTRPYAERRDADWERCISEIVADFWWLGKLGVSTLGRPDRRRVTAGVARLPIERRRPPPDPVDPREAGLRVRGRFVSAAVEPLGGTVEVALQRRSGSATTPEFRTETRAGLSMADPASSTPESICGAPASSTLAAIRSPKNQGFVRAEVRRLAATTPPFPDQTFESRPSEGASKRRDPGAPPPPTVYVCAPLPPRLVTAR